MTQAQFQTLVACIAKVSIAWLHEGVVMKLNRDKGGDPISNESVMRFCREIRSFLDDIEQQITPSNEGAGTLSRDNLTTKGE